jgi:hypothetical protein
MNGAGFLGCLGVEALKLKRTTALALAVLLPAATAGMFLVFILQNGDTSSSRGANPAVGIVLGLVGLWAIFILPIFAAIETSLLAAIEHQNRGWKHLFALPPARRSLFAAKFAAAALLVAIAHTLLFGYTLVVLWAVSKLQPSAGSSGPIPVVASLVIVAVCAVSSLFMVGVHTAISLRWPSFALNVGIALSGLLFALGMLDSRLGQCFPWSLPALAHKIVVPWVFGLPGWPGGPAGPESLTIILAISVGGFVATAVGGGWLLSRRDVI